MKKELSISIYVRLSIAVVLLLGLAVTVSEALSRGQGQSVNVSTRQAGDAGLKQLLMTLRDDSLRYRDPDRVAEAIKGLGEAKSTEAIDDLIGLLTFTRISDSETQIGDAIIETHMITPAGRFPAIGALIQIGKPSLPGLIEVIEAHDSASLESDNAWYAVMIIFKDHPARGVEHMRKAAANASSTQEAQRLSHAADKIAEVVAKLGQRQ